MGTTTNYSLPYPAETDAPDGASQIQSLATAVDTAILGAIAGQFVKPLFARKATDEGRASTTTLANDTSLVLAGLVSGGIYDVEGVIFYSGGAGASEGDLKFGWATPAGSSGRYWRTHNTVSQADGKADTTWSESDAAGTNGVSTVFAHTINGLLIAGAAGSLQFKWAQNSSNSTQSHVLANSKIKALRTG
jgi:hypothetical protein